jgi:hypothetical protein
MKAARHAIAVLELLLVFPAVLFMTGLFLRNIQPAPYEPAHSARLLVKWFSARPFLGLAIFLVALPFAALVIGCACVRHGWRSDSGLRRDAIQTLAVMRTHAASVLIAAATVMAGGVLVIVALHSIAD